MHALYKKNLITFLIYSKVVQCQKNNLSVKTIVPSTRRCQWDWRINGNGFSFSNLVKRIVEFVWQCKWLFWYYIKRKIYLACACFRLDYSYSVIIIVISAFVCVTYSISLPATFKWIYELSMLLSYLTYNFSCYVPPK